MHNDEITRKDIVDEVAKLTQSIDRWRVKIEVRQNDQHRVLFGNGTPGLDEEIRNIKTGLGVLVKLAWIIMTAIVISAVTGVISALAYLIRTMPP